MRFDCVRAQQLLGKAVAQGKSATAYYYLGNCSRWSGNFQLAEKAYNLGLAAPMDSPRIEDGLREAKETLRLATNPAALQAYIQANYPGQYAPRIEMDPRLVPIRRDFEYEVAMTNRATHPYTQRITGWFSKATSRSNYDKSTTNWASALDASEAVSTGGKHLNLVSYTTSSVSNGVPENGSLSFVNVSKQTYSNLGGEIYSSQSRCKVAPIVDEKILNFARGPVVELRCAMNIENSINSEFASLVFMESGISIGTKFGGGIVSDVSADSGALRTVNKYSASIYRRSK